MPCSVLCVTVVQTVFFMLNVLRIGLRCLLVSTGSSVQQFKRLAFFFECLNSVMGPRTVAGYQKV